MEEKSSSSSTRADGFAGHVGAPSAHGDADVGRFQGRGIVHAVAGHGHDFAVGLEGVDQAQFLFRHDPGKDIDRPDPLLKLGVIHPVQLGPGDHFVHGCQADLPGDVLGRARIVAGDHHHPDAGGVALLDGAGTVGRTGSARPTSPRNSN